MKQVISVSKRTDIPYWHPEWFMERAKAGFVQYQNPMGPQIVTVSLKPEDVSAIVFWTKNFSKMLGLMPEFETYQIPYYTQYTINAYPEEYEAKVGPLGTRIEAFKGLALKGNPVFWRNDPIIISAATPVEGHLARFKEIAARLEGYTDKCHISFLDMYAKTKRNMARLHPRFHPQELPQDEMDFISTEMQLIARAHGIEVVTCAETKVNPRLVMPGACIDRSVILKLTGATPPAAYNNRPGCGCAQHRDIGAYDTCPSGCVYCYAVGSQKASIKFMKEIKDDTRASLRPLRQAI